MDYTSWNGTSEENLSLSLTRKCLHPIFQGFAPSHTKEGEYLHAVYILVRV